MRATLEEFRREAQKRKRGRRSGPSEYPAGMREFALAFAREALESGCSKTRAARDLGVSAMTLDKWLSESTGEAAPAFREIAVEPEGAAARSLVLVTPAGLRVEGLDVESAAALLAKLG